MKSLNVRFIHFLHVYNRLFVVVGYNSTCHMNMYTHMLEHMNGKEILIFSERGGGRIKVCLSVILLNYEFIYIGDPLMGGDTHRVCDF